MMKNNRFFLVVMMALLMVPAMLFAQVQTTGTVVDASNGEPIIGASVLEVGTTNGTVTDWDGKFVLTVQNGAQLQVSYMGYKTQTVAAQAVVNVKLGEDTELLDEVVVVGYGVAKKSDVTGSVTAIKPDEKNKGLVTNAQDMIQGKIAGVNVTSNSGAAGGGSTIRVRGGSSLNASNDPLIVIDGLAMDNQGVKGLSNPLSMVNPADIETFTVLKDASATAIYGSRGANGVIIITTKKGEKSKIPSVSYNGSVGFSTPVRYTDVMNANDYRVFIKDYYGEDSEAFHNLGNANTNWQKEIYRTGVNHDHNVTISGTVADVMPYRVSVGFTGQQGILKTNDFKRTTASVNLSPSLLNKHLSFNFNLKYMNARTQYANTDAIGSAARFDPTQPVKVTDGEEYVLAGDKTYKVGADAFSNFNGYFQWLKPTTEFDETLKAPWPYINERNCTKNPVSQLYEKEDKANSNAVITNLEADYKIHGFEDLRLHANIALDYSQGKQTTNFADWGPSNAYYGNEGYSLEKKYNLQFSTYAQYYKDFENDHHFDIMVGYEWSHMKYWGNSLYTSFYPFSTKHPGTDGVRDIYSGGKQNEWAQESYLVSFFARAMYSWKDRYILQATVRADGSSRFQKHWACFPSFAFAWRMSQEDWMKDINEISDMKLRLGYGMTGQQDGIGNYNWFASYNVNTAPDSYYPILGDGTIYRPDAYNPQLKWETATTYNIGYDISLFRDRLGMNIDYYYKKTTDLINWTPVPAGSNFRNYVTSNIGSMFNQGVEVAFNFKPISQKDYFWEITLNGTYNMNKITELTGEGSIVTTGGISSGTGNTCQAHMVGHAKSSFYVYQQVYDEAGKPVEGVFVDRNADGKINADDKYLYKTPDAPFIMGLSTRVQIKNFDFGMNFHGSFGNYVFNDNEASYANVLKTYDSSFGNTQNLLYKSADVLRSWTSYDNVLSDYFVQNGSFFKCDNITVGYSFSNLGKTDKYKGVSGRVYATVNNVFTITKYSGVDPEVVGGIDNNIYPRPLSGLLGVNFNF